MEDKKFEGEIKKYNNQLSKKILALENYKENVNYRKDEVEELEIEVKKQQDRVENLDKMAMLAGDRSDISFSDKMIEDKDKLRELNSRLEKRKIIQSEVKEKGKNLTYFIDEIIEKKNSIKGKISEISEETLKKAIEIKQHKEEIDKLTDEIVTIRNQKEEVMQNGTNEDTIDMYEKDVKEKQKTIKEKTEMLNELISSKKEMDTKRKELMKKLGAINKVIKSAQAYLKDGIVPDNISKESEKAEKTENTNSENGSNNIPEKQKESGETKGTDGPKGSKGSEKPKGQKETEKSNKTKNTKKSNTKITGTGTNNTRTTDTKTTDKKTSTTEKEKPETLEAELANLEEQPVEKKTQKDDSITQLELQEKQVKQELDNMQAKWDKAIKNLNENEEQIRLLKLANRELPENSEQAQNNLKEILRLGTENEGLRAIMRENVITSIKGAELLKRQREIQAKINMAKKGHDETIEINETEVKETKKTKIEETKETDETEVKETKKTKIEETKETDETEVEETKITDATKEINETEVEETKETDETKEDEHIDSNIDMNQCKVVIDTSSGVVAIAEGNVELARVNLEAVLMSKNEKMVRKEVEKKLNELGQKKYAKLINRLKRKINPVVFTALKEQLQLSDNPDFVCQYLDAVKHGDYAKLPFDYDVIMDENMSISEKTFTKLNKYLVRDNKNLGTNFPVTPVSPLYAIKKLLHRGKTHKNISEAHIEDPKDSVISLAEAREKFVSGVRNENGGTYNIDHNTKGKEKEPDPWIVEIDK